MKLRRQRKGDPLETEPLGLNRIPPHVGLPPVTPARQGFWDFEDLRGLFGGGGYSSRLLEKVGVANRCLQLCAQQISAMPLRYRRSAGRDPEAPDPQWVSNPDPAWYPNGIHDAIFAAMWSFYAHGDAFCYTTSRYADGYPQTWTVLDPITMRVGSEGGQRTYESNGFALDPSDVLQVTRNPTGALRGTGALQAYAANLIGASVADAYAADVLTSGGVPHTVLRPARRVTAEQAAELQAQWVSRASDRLGAPAVIPPDLQFEQLAWSPADLLLLDSRRFEGSQICGAFGVPPPLVALPIDQGGLTYTNTSDLFEIWWRSELYPAGHRLDQALNTWLPRGNWVEFDPSAILAPALAQKIDVATKAITAKLLTENEARAWVFDLPPLPPEAVDMIDEPAGVDQGTPEPALTVVPREETTA